MGAARSKAAGDGGWGHSPGRPEALPAVPVLGRSLPTGKEPTHRPSVAALLPSLPRGAHLVSRCWSWDKAQLHPRARHTPASSLGQCSSYSRAAGTPP